jgi:hypothetical protein
MVWIDRAFVISSSSAATSNAGCAMFYQQTGHSPGLSTTHRTRASRPAIRYWIAQSDGRLSSETDTD